MIIPRISIFLLLCFSSCAQVQMTTVKHKSRTMIPTIKPGEVIDINLSHYTEKLPKRWDIVLFEYPNKNFLAVLRIVGLPGELIRINTDQGVIIDGVKIVVPNAVPTNYKKVSKGEHGVNAPYKIPDKAFFLMGDNPPWAKDSRYLGAISRDLILGLVLNKGVH